VGGGEDWQCISDVVVISCGAVQVKFCNYAWVERLFVIWNFHTLLFGRNNSISSYICIFLVSSVFQTHAFFHNNVQNCRFTEMFSDMCIKQYICPFETLDGRKY
jgi:hypothetical protein